MTAPPRHKLTPAEREWMHAYSADPAIKRARKRRAAALRVARVTGENDRYRNAEQAMCEAVYAFNKRRPYPMQEER